MGDPLIVKATEAALDFTEGLPNYVCQEMMARYESTTHPANWQAFDVVSAAVVYDNGKEDYRDITINGKPIKKKMDQMEGSWSTGEFGTVLIDLLSPATAAQFRYRREERTSGVITKVYDYTREARELALADQHGRSDLPAGLQRFDLGGSVDRARAAHRDAGRRIPARISPPIMWNPPWTISTPVWATPSSICLPVHAENLSCQRGSDNCSHNVIDFRNYHKYSGESSITFNDVKK